MMFKIDNCGFEAELTGANHRFQAALLLGLEKVEIERTYR